MAEFKLAIIGAGNMAKAMLEGILRAGLLPAESMMVTNRSVGKLEILSEYCCIRTSYDNGEAAQFGDVIVLAVKPSDLRVACQQLQPHLRVGQLVISVAAGRQWKRSNVGWDAMTNRWHAPCPTRRRRSGWG